MWTAPGSPPVPASTLAEAWEALEPGPLHFGGDRANGHGLYVPRPERFEEGLRVRGPAETLQQRLLGSPVSAKMFLSGHPGNGQSTELRRLATSDAIRKAFIPILLAVEEGHRPHLDLAQLLFLMAYALFDHGRGEALFSPDNAWMTPLREIERRLDDEAVRATKQGGTSAEPAVFFAKVHRELKVSEGSRRRLRAIGEANLALLIDLVKGLALDLQRTSMHLGEARAPLLLIDDLDKVYEPSAHEDIFRENLSVLFEPPMAVLYTVPAAVVRDRCPDALRQRRVHLAPVPVLKRQVRGSPTFDPEQSMHEVGVSFLEAVLRPRVAPGLFSGDAVRKAAVYSGGLIGTFFCLLRAGLDVAQANDLTEVDGRVMRVALGNERLNESRGIREEHYVRLVELHRTNGLSQATAGRRSHDESHILEAHDDRAWYEVNPLLWVLLAPHCSRGPE